MKLARTAGSSGTRSPRARSLALPTLLGLLATALACPGPVGSGGSPSNATAYPPAAVYDLDPEFGGEWYGDVDGQRGTLVIGPINERTYYGSFVSDDTTREYTLLLDHTFIERPNSGELPSNRATFTWQDGLGSRGKGWLLIDQSDRALSGSFGFGVATSGLGSWSFIRAEPS